MKKLINKLFIIVLVLGIFAPSSQLQAITASRAAQCFFTPNRSHCSDQETEAAKKIMAKLRKRVMVATKVGFFTAEAIVGILLWMWWREQQGGYLFFDPSQSFDQTTAHALQGRFGGFFRKTGMMTYFYSNKGSRLNPLRILPILEYAGAPQLAIAGHGIYNLYKTLRYDIKKLVDEEKEPSTPEQTTKNQIR